MSDAVLKYGEPENYVNRELSWLEFNYRILGEARDKTTPLFERLKFLSITASNLDEFFMVRVASLKDMVHANYTKRDIAGMTAQEQLDAIDGKTHELVENQYRIYNRMLLPLLKQHGLRVVTEHEKLPRRKKRCTLIGILRNRSTRSSRRWRLIPPARSRLFTINR